MSEELLRLNHLSIDYKVKDGYLSAVNDISCVINKGEVFAIVGESGCGKSTVAHSIMSLLPGGNEVVTGEINFKGRNLRECTQKELEAIRGKEIGMIFQNPLDSLNPVYTVGDQTAEAILLDKVDKTEAWNRVIKLFKDVKMPDADERVKSFPHELSGGMRQRVSFARTLVQLWQGRELLLLDEPFSALDSLTRISMQDWLIGQVNDLNATVMMVTHDVEEAMLIGNKIFLLSGRPVKDICIIYVSGIKCRDDLYLPQSVKLKNRLVSAFLTDNADKEERSGV